MSVRSLFVIGLLPLGATLVLSLSQGSRVKETYAERKDIPVRGTSWDPDPRWVRAKWLPGDQEFVQISSTARKAIQQTPTADSAKLWKQLVKGAYQEWYSDHQYALNLHRVSCFLAVVAVHDPQFSDSGECQGMRSKVNKGWSYLRNIPQSYDFVRRGYLVNAGDDDCHNFGDLAQRLLKKNSTDRSVIVSMVKEYHRRRPEASFETAMFSGLTRLLKSPLKRHDDEKWQAMAYRMYARNHKKKAAYETAIAIMERLAGASKTVARKNELLAIADSYRAEMALPNFGIPPGGKYVGG